MATAVLDIPVVTTIRVSVCIEDGCSIPGVEDIIKERVTNLVAALSTPIEIGEVPENVSKLVSEAASEGSLRKRRGRPAKASVDAPPAEDVVPVEKTPPAEEVSEPAPVEPTADPVPATQEEAEPASEPEPVAEDLPVQESQAETVSAEEESVGSTSTLTISGVISVGDFIIRKRPWAADAKHSPAKVTEVLADKVRTPSGQVSFGALDDKYELCDAAGELLPLRVHEAPQEATPAGAFDYLDKIEAETAAFVATEPTESVDIPEDHFGFAGDSDSDSDSDPDEQAPPAEIIDNSSSLPLSQCLKPGDRIANGVGDQFTVGAGSNSEVVELVDRDGKSEKLVVFMIDNFYTRVSTAQETAA